MGNLIPALVWLVPTLIGLQRVVQTHQLFGIGLVYLGLATILGWLALNQFGFYQNGRMRRRLLAILGKNNGLPPERFFVGFSTPKYSGALDAHEDVGFLCATDECLVFISETRTSDLRKDEITKISFRPNVHTMVGLGRWISIEGKKNGQPVRMLIEPRERNTMLGNLFYGKRFIQKLRELVGLKK